MSASANTSLVWRLLRRNISLPQLIGYTLANLVGLAIVLSALQFYRDVRSIWNAEDSLISRDYLIISKRVKGITIGTHSGEFTQGEIAELEQQPWLRSLGRFNSAGFRVGASLDIWGRGMSTALFLEAIPDRFYDVKPAMWKWEPTVGRDGEYPPVPIIISKDYLTLYNFGFAASRGYPQISEATIGELPIRLYLSGRGREMRLQGRIVGFSSRLNTFAVPESFLEWANSQLADEPAQQPSRLILEVNTPGDPAIQRYLDEHSYESAGDKADTGRAAYFLSLATGTVMSVGVLISILAFFILVLSIYLLIQKNRQKLHSLMMLGYSPAAVARQYYIIVGVLNAIVLAGAVAAVLVARSYWGAALGEIGAESASPWFTIAVGLVIILVVTDGNMRIIRREISKTFPRPRR